MLICNKIVVSSYPLPPVPERSRGKHTYMKRRVNIPWSDALYGLQSKVNIQYAFKPRKEV
jgi:hypothetical protein